MRLKITDELCVMTKNNNEIDLLFQNGHEEFEEFWSEHSNVSKILHFNGFLLNKVYV